MQHEWERKKVHKGLWWEHLSETDHLEDLGENGLIISERTLKTRGVDARTGMNWLRRGTGGGLL
jgi:hypothetical protein